MRTTCHGCLAGWALGIGLLAAVSPATAAAAEGWAEIGWRGKWGSGSIVYNRDAAPSDPMDGGATFRNSIGPFHIVGWDMTTPHHFIGYGGTMITRNGLDPACHPMEPCPMYSVVIQLGPLSTGSPAQWQVNYTARGWLDPLGLPRLSDESYPRFEGYLSNNLDDRTYGLADEVHPSWHISVAAPVPEPGPFGLSLLGVATLGIASRRRLGRAVQASPTGVGPGHGAGKPA